MLAVAGLLSHLTASNGGNRHEIPCVSGMPDAHLCLSSSLWAAIEVGLASSTLSRQLYTSSNWVLPELQAYSHCRHLGRPSILDAKAVAKGRVNSCDFLAGASSRRPPPCLRSAARWWHGVGIACPFISPSKETVESTRGPLAVRSAKPGAIASTSTVQYNAASTV